jgi:hypothetical protein
MFKLDDAMKQFRNPSAAMAIMDDRRAIGI